MKFAFIVPHGERYPLHKVGPHPRGDFVQNWVNAVPGDIWEGNEFADGGAIEALNTYDVIMVNLNTQQLDICADLATRFDDWPHRPKILALDGGSVDDLSVLPTHCRIGLIRAARAVDAYCTFQPWAEKFWQVVTDKPVRYVGCPTPVSMIRQFRKPWSERKKRIAVGVQLGIGSGVDRNGIGTVMALMKAIQELGDSDWRIDIAYTHDAELELAKQFGWDCRLDMHKVVWQMDYWNYISDARIGIMLDLRYTWGRFASNMAGLAIPCIGTNRNGTQGLLFPDLTVEDPFKEMGRALNMIRALLRDDTGEITQQVCAYADTVLDAEFSEEAAGTRLRAVCAELGVF